MKSVVRIALVLCGAGWVFSSFVPRLFAAETSAGSGCTAHEYAEVRTIAMKDAHVREAYQRAEARIEDRMLEIDPTLKLSPRKKEQDHEYVEVRKIAMKDARVQAAYDDAEQRLEERVIEIDPSLKGYAEKHNVLASSPVQKSAHPAASPKHSAARKTPTPPAGAATHVVAKGETLSGIAVQYHVSVASLKTANNITDERKLQAGQKLVIPAAKSSGQPAKSGQPAQSSGQPAKQEQGFWDKVKDAF